MLGLNPKFNNTIKIPHPQKSLSFQKLLSDVRGNVKAHCALIASVIVYTVVLLGE